MHEPKLFFGFSGKKIPWGYAPRDERGGLKNEKNGSGCALSFST
jgi:hypothetical protein